MSVFGLLADGVLVAHALFIAFVVFGQVLILLGLLLGWRWVRNFRFRIAHLAAIGIVVVQAWIGVLCPLTILENAPPPRGRAGLRGLLYRALVAPDHLLRRRAMGFHRGLYRLRRRRRRNMDLWPAGALMRRHLRYLPRP